MRKLLAIGEFTTLIIGIVLSATCVGLLLVFAENAINFVMDDIYYNHGIFTVIIIAVAIAVIYLMHRKLKQEENEKERLKRIMDENSLYYEEKLLNSVLNLKDNKKQVFCQLYNIPNENEDILKFISEKWDKTEMESIYVQFYYLKKFPEKYRNVAFMHLPKSFVCNVLERDNYICQKCGKNLLSLETKEQLTKNSAYISLIKPFSEGGCITEDNLITSCIDCEHHLISSKMINECENTPIDYNLNVTNIKKGDLSFDFPDYYLNANIPENCPDCVAALAKDNGKCDVLIEVMEDKIEGEINIVKFKFDYMKYVKDLDEFSDIKELDIETLNIINEYNHKNACFIALSNFKKDQQNTELAKSIIYFEFDYYNAIRIRITLNSLLEDEYNCMNDLCTIVNSLEYLGLNREGFR